MKRILLLFAILAPLAWGQTQIVGPLGGSSGGGGAATPGGSGTQMQYRDGSALGGVAGSSWDGSLLGLPQVNVPSLRLAGVAPLNHRILGDGTDFVASPLKYTVTLEIFAKAETVTVGDGARELTIPVEINGYVLSGVVARVYTVGTTGTLNVQVARCAAVATGSQCSGTVSNMLSTVSTVDSGEANSTTADTPAVIDLANDDVATDQVLRIDVKAVPTTPPAGLYVELTFAPA